jgi:hypothetical protein
VVIEKRTAAEQNTITTKLNRDLASAKREREEIWTGWKNEREKDTPLEGEARGRSASEKKSGQVETTKREDNRITHSRTQKSKEKKN